MTFVAATVLPEAGARALADSVAGNERFSAQGIDLHEIGPGAWQVAVYFEARPSPAERDALAQLARAAAGGCAQPFALQALPPTDWVAKSLRELSPVRAGRFLVHGRHDRSRALPNDIAIEIDAGLAFGTGHHGTTAGCLIAIDRLAGRRPIGNALDLGTGSGVLAIAIARRAKAAVVAGDIDPVAVAVARDNARLNGVASRVTAVVAAGFGARAIRAHAPYDLIVANILAAPLVALANDVRRNLAPGGSVILSGLLTTQRRRVAAIYRCQGLRPTDAIVIGGWATLVLRR